MKRKYPFLMLALGLVVGLAGSSHAGYKLSLPREYDPYIVGARDLHNGVWMTGTSVEMVHFVRTDDNKPILYLAVNHLYALHNKAIGSVGATVGVHTGKLGDTIVRVAQVILPDQYRRLGWLQTISNYASVEAGGGYRAWGPEPPHGSRWYYTIGGRVKIPLSKFWDLLSNQ